MRTPDSDCPVPDVRFSQLSVLRGHSKSVASVKFGGNGLLVTASADKSVRIWDLTEGRQVQVLRGHTQGVSDASWSKQGNHIASASDDNMVKLWDAESGKCLRTLQGHTNYVFCCTFSPEGNLLASGSFDETLRLWDVRSGRCLREVPAHSDPLTAVDFSHDGTLIVTSSLDGLMRVWDTASGQCLRTMCDKDSPPVSNVRFAPNGKYILSSTLDSQIRLWDYERVTAVRAYSGSHVNKQFCAFSSFCTAIPGVPMVVAGSEDGSISLYDLTTAKVIQRIPASQTGATSNGGAKSRGHSDAVLAIDCHPTQALMASGGHEKDPTVRIWSNGIDAFEDQGGDSDGADAAMMPELDLVDNNGVGDAQAGPTSMVE